MFNHSKRRCYNMLQLSIWTLLAFPLKVCVASACNMFPDASPMDAFLREGTSPSAFAKMCSAVQSKIGSTKDTGTPWDSLGAPEKRARVA